MRVQPASEGASSFQPAACVIRRRDQPGKVFRRDAQLDRPLLVGRVAEGIHAAARRRQFSGENREIGDQPNRVDRPARSHHVPPEQDHRPLRPGIHGGRGLDRRAGKSSARLKVGPREAAGQRRQPPGIRRRRGGERRIDAARLHHGLDEAQDGGPLLPGGRRERVRRPVDEVAHERTVVGAVAADRDERGAAVARRVLDAVADDGVGLGQVGADDDDRLRLPDVLVGGGHPAVPDHVAQRRDRVVVAVARRAVDVGAAEDEPHELLEQVQVFVGGLRRDDPADRAPSVLRLDRGEALGDQGRRLEPRRVDERPGFADERLLQPVVPVDHVEAKVALRAEIARVAAAARVGRDPERDVVAALHLQPAPVGAVRADRLDLLELPRAVVVHRHPAGQRAHRADLDAPAAKLTIQLLVHQPADLQQAAAVA
jgi:hypothetical protein